MNHPIAVLDINVFVSGTTIAQSYPSQVLDLWKHGFYQLAISELMLQRMRQVYSYPKVVRLTHMGRVDVDNFLDNIRGSAIVVPGTTNVNVCEDPEDNQLFSCALEAEANYIVSGDKKHVLAVDSYKGIKTLSPKDFIAEILTT
ncbi:MAG: putative toxin-antitoxin system toxin component, PIN family [Patescibacteria group bacterium]